MEFINGFSLKPEDIDFLQICLAFLRLISSVSTSTIRHDSSRTEPNPPGLHLRRDNFQEKKFQSSRVSTDFFMLTADSSKVSIPSFSSPSLLSILSLGGSTYISQPAYHLDAKSSSTRGVYWPQLVGLVFQRWHLGLHQFPWRLHESAMKCTKARHPK